MSCVACLACASCLMWASMRSSHHWIWASSWAQWVWACWMTSRAIPGSSLLASSMTPLKAWRSAVAPWANTTPNSPSMPRMRLLQAVRSALRLAGRAMPEAWPFARHKQSSGLFESRLSLRAGGAGTAGHEFVLRRLAIGHHFSSSIYAVYLNHAFCQINANSCHLAPGTSPSKGCRLTYPKPILAPDAVTVKWEVPSYSRNGHSMLLKTHSDGPLAMWRCSRCGWAFLPGTGVWRWEAPCTRARCKWFSLSWVCCLPCRCWARRWIRSRLVLGWRLWLVC